MIKRNEVCNHTTKFYVNKLSVFSFAMIHSFVFESTLSRFVTQNMMVFGASPKVDDYNGLVILKTYNIF